MPFSLPATEPPGGDFESRQHLQSPPPGAKTSRPRTKERYGAALRATCIPFGEHEVIVAAALAARLAICVAHIVRAAFGVELEIYLY